MMFKSGTIEEFPEKFNSFPHTVEKITLLPGKTGCSTEYGLAPEI
jgi:hypothetical protein